MFLSSKFLVANVISFFCLYLMCNWSISLAFSVCPFKMIEPELAFADLNDDMACATAYLQYVVCQLSHHL